MSIDIDWTRLTSGPDGVELAESIRDFIHEKFQQVELPRFIRSVNVHSFAFGEECPQVEIKDINDPWAEFYEDDEDEDESEDDEEDERSRVNPSEEVVNQDRRKRPGVPADFKNPHGAAPSISIKPRLADMNISLSSRNLNLHGLHAQSDPFTALSRSSTPGIPGGASNLSYFHLPLNAGLKSGSQTPMSAAFHPPSRTDTSGRNIGSFPFPPPLPIPLPQTKQAQALHDETKSPTSSETNDSRVLDIQTTLHITYDGSLSLSLTAELLLDYPMPSFMGIPLALRITGLSFEGVALLAYLRAKKKKASGSGNNVGDEADNPESASAEAKGRCQFCFLGEEEGKAVIGGGGNRDADGGVKERLSGQETGSPLKEIRIETTIGRQGQEDAVRSAGGQASAGGGNTDNSNGNRPVVLKNVGKVEKFVLEQVRRIFEEEFVWPSFWTFLL